IREPKYDDQKVVYAGIEKLLDEATTDLSSTTGRRPTNNDLLFAGDMTKWVKLAKFLQARTQLRLAYAPGEDKAARANKALTALAGALQSNADDADFAYPGGANARNPNYTFVELRRPEAHRGGGAAHPERRRGSGRAVPRGDPRPHAEARRRPGGDRRVRREAAGVRHARQPARGDHHAEVHRELPQGRAVERLAAHRLPAAAGAGRAGQAAEHSAAHPHAGLGALQQHQPGHGDGDPAGPRGNDGEGVVGGDDERTTLTGSRPCRASQASRLLY